MPAPPQWYGLLPDITYTWRVRTSGATTFVGLDDPSWSPFAERRFRTPAVSSATISAVSPAAGSTVSSRTPVLQWADSRNDVSYYHPPNSYAVPAAFPLEPGTPYFWRVRPRVQGDGAPVAWSEVFRFSTG